ncbi:MAG: hypothetical protein HZC37_26315 [Burkholderiales bacterium]|nr:hypothetical protein [Burkholderiales bacterium]
MRAGLLTTAIVVVAAASAGLGCTPRDAAPSDPRAAVLATATSAASEIHAALPRHRPGFGTTDYPGHAEGDVPKAYAMVLLAELQRRGRAWRSGEADLARVAGDWLLANADSNGDGVIGWGLPVAWDAYDDGSVNPAHTEYTITTAIVIDALLTWAERDALAPHARIRELVHAAVSPYLDGRIASPSGIAPYSLAAADRRYDTFNPAAYLAGQVQRASLGVADPRERERYLAAADATMRALLKHRQLAPGSGHWYWNYSVQQALPNDLPHAGYMIAGIRAYLEHGGRLAEQFDWYAVLQHLADFRGAAGEVRAFPTFRPGLKLAARSYDLGFALHLACTETRTAPLVPWLMAAVEGYRTPAKRYLKYPHGGASAAAATPASTPALVINEYEAYLYRGLSSCALAPMGPTAVSTSGSTSGLASVPLPGPAPSPSAEVRLASSPETSALARRLAGASASASTSASAGASSNATDARAQAGAPGPVVPLLPAEAGLVSFDASRRPLLVRADGTVLAIVTPGVPVKVLARGRATYVFHRRYPDDRLALLQYEGERLVCRLEVEHGDDPTAVASLRAATLHGQRLHAVVYHNPSQANWHLAWHIAPASAAHGTVAAAAAQQPAGACPVRTGVTAKLPSLEEPAGSTYEMIPSLHFHVVAGAAGERLWLAGGNMQLEIGTAGPMEPRRIPGCRHIVESAPTPAGLAHLCVAAAVDPHSGARALVVVAPEGVQPPPLDPALGVPGNLRWSLGALQIDHARSAAQLRRLLRRDLAATAPGGWMEFGINNEEGRIPWSQIYYLNGLLDLLDLARRDAALLELFGPLLAEVRLRLDVEMRWLDAQVAAGRHRTRAFTVDRSRALFGVQTARFLLVMHRYLREVPDAAALASYADLKRAVQRLEGHIEVLATEGEEPKWIRPGLHHLRWPKGSAFHFDGMPVPYNHQNEWAYAVLATADEHTTAPTLQAATDVIGHFTDRIAPAGALPASGAWDYWWGRAYDGWDEPGRHSMHVPRYGGDKIKAWISFRTIDAMSLVAGAARLGPQEAANARASAQALAARGLLYPFANHAWVNEATAIHLGAPAAHEYARVSAPWELGSAVWSAAALGKRWRGD